MSDHLALAKLCQQSYGESSLPVQTISGVVFAVVGNKVIFRGSKSEQDWLRDFEASPVDHPQLGKVEEGFMDGMQDVFRWLRVSGPPNPTITGHSLGGAHAAILAALCTSNDVPWQELVTFGCPRPGYVQLRNILQNSGRPMTAYRDGKDIVPTEPPAFLWLKYRSYTDWTHIGEGDDPISDHLIANYIEALS